MNLVVGKVWKQDEGFKAVVGEEFTDSPGYFQFYVVGENDHFRQRLGPTDKVEGISLEVWQALKEANPPPGVMR